MMAYVDDEDDDNDENEDVDVDVEELDEHDGIDERNLDDKLAEADRLVRKLAVQLGIVLQILDYQMVDIHPVHEDHLIHLPYDILEYCQDDDVGDKTLLVQNLAGHHKHAFVAHYHLYRFLSMMNVSLILDLVYSRFRIREHDVDIHQDDFHCLLSHLDLVLLVDIAIVASALKVPMIVSFQFQDDYNDWLIVADTLEILDEKQRG